MKNKLWEDKMKEEVEAAIDKYVRPFLRADGGDIELIDVKDGVAIVQLTGACVGCPMSQLTLKQGVEQILKEHVKHLKAVEAV